MANFGAKDVQKLRQSTGAGMLDAKKALESNDGDFEKAALWLREKGLASAAKRQDRENSQGAVAIAKQPNSIAMVELKCETDFVAKSNEFVNLVNSLAEAVAKEGEGVLSSHLSSVQELQVALKENITLGRSVYFESSEGSILDSYLHIQNDRGVNGVIVELEGADASLAHDIAVHIAFTRPSYLSKEDVPADLVEKERSTLETISRNEGKPEAALPKIVEGRLGGWYKERVLLEQNYVKDEKQTIKSLLGNAKISRFSQIIIGA